MSKPSKVFLALLFVSGAESLLAEPRTNQLGADLHWVCDTNWAHSHSTRTLMAWSGDRDPNITTYYESGSIVSNLIATLSYHGKHHGVVLETKQIGSMLRTYKMQEQKVYGPEGKPHWYTNSISATNWIIPIIGVMTNSSTNWETRPSVPGLRVHP